MEQVEFRGSSDDGEVLGGNHQGDFEDEDQNYNFLNDYSISEDNLEYSDSDSSFLDEDEVFRKKLAAWAKETTLTAVTKLLLILR